MPEPPNIGDLVRPTDTSWSQRWQVIGFKSDPLGVSHAIIEAPETLERRTFAVATLCDPDRFQVERRAAGRGRV